MSDRTSQLIGDILRRIHEAIVDNDVASAVKPDLIVHPEPADGGDWAISYDLSLAAVRAPAFA